MGIRMCRGRCRSGSSDVSIIEGFLQEGEGGNSKDGSAGVFCEGSGCPGCRYPDDLSVVVEQIHCRFREQLFSPLGLLRGDAQVIFSHSHDSLKKRRS